MKINKNEIIDEIISIEPELKNKRENIEKIFDDFLLIKPEVNISSDFKNDLKKDLLLKIRNNGIISKENKYNYLKNLFSFLLGGIVTYSMIGLLGFNLDFLDLGKKSNINMNNKINDNTINTEIKNDNSNIFSENQIKEEGNNIINNTQPENINNNIINKEVKNNNSNIFSENQKIEDTENKIISNSSNINNNDTIIKSSNVNEKQIDNNEITITTEIVSSSNVEGNKGLDFELKKYFKKIGFNNEQINKTLIDTNNIINNNKIVNNSSNLNINETTITTEVESSSDVESSKGFIIELKKYFKKIPLTREEINKIISIIKKYN